MAAPAEAPLMAPDADPPAPQTQDLKPVLDNAQKSTTAIEPLPVVPPEHIGAEKTAPEPSVSTESHISKVAQHGGLAEVPTDSLAPAQDTPAVSKEAETSSVPIAPQANIIPLPVVAPVEPVAAHIAVPSADVSTVATHAATMPSKAAVADPEEDDLDDLDGNKPQYEFRY
jgi:hypothetical protein